MTLPQAIHLSILAGLPWWWGGSPDVARYGTAAVLLATTGIWLWRSAPLPSHVAGPAAALAAWGALQAAVTSRSPVLTVDSALILAAMLAVVVFWAHEARDERIARRLAYAVLATATLQAVFGVLQAAWRKGSLYGRIDPAIASPYGSFANHNHFAGLMEMGALLAAAMAFGRARRVQAADAKTVVLAGIALTIAAAHAASRSRGGLFALLCGALVLAGLALVGRRQATRGRALLAAAGAAVVLVAFGVMAVPATTRAHLATLFQGPSDSSGHYRVAIAAATLRLWASAPVAGAGLGTFEDEVTRFKTSEGRVRTAHAESDILEYVAEAGLVGVGLAGWLGWMVAAGFLDRQREGRDPWHRGIAQGAMAAVAAIGAHSLVDFNLRIPSNALVFAALVGLAAAPRTTPARSIFPLAARIATVVLLVVAASAAWRTVGAAALARARGSLEPDTRLKRVSAAIAIHPYLPSAYRERAHARWLMGKAPGDVGRFHLTSAQSDITRALALRPAWAIAWCDLGWIHYLQGRRDEAHAAFQRALALDPADMRVGLTYGDLLVREGRRDEALQELRRIRRYNSDWSDSAAQDVARRWGLKLK